MKDLLNTIKLDYVTKLSGSGRGTFWNNPPDQLRYSKLELQLQRALKFETRIRIRNLSQLM